MKLVHTSLGARKSIEQNLHNYGGPAKLIYACLYARRNIKSSFHHCGGHGKLVEVM